jgi:PAS domain S-box-containing protein
MTKTVNSSSVMPIRVNSPLRVVLALCLAALASYLSGRLASALVLRPEMIWPFWPGNAVLTAVLLLTPWRIWPALLIAGLSGFAVSDVQVGLPIRDSVLLCFADSVEILIVALGVRYVFGGVLRLQSVKSLAKYSVFALILAPVAVASVATGAFNRGSWPVGFLSEALALFTLTPAVLSWTELALAPTKKTKLFYLEAMAMCLGLGTLAYFTFVESGSYDRPVMLYSLVPFLLWSALRFGIAGTSNCLVLVAGLAVLGNVHGHGPFRGDTAVAGALSLQLFLLVAGSSFMLLAAVAEQDKAAKQAIRESEQRFRSVADTAPALIWMSGPDKLCTYFNQPWLDFTGRSLAQELGNGWVQGVYAEDLQRCLDTYSRSFDRREKFAMEYRVRHHDGAYRWILDIGVPRFDGQSFVGYIGIALDLTERKQAEQALSESEERLRLAAQAGRMFAYSWDAATNTMECSGESTEILGVKEEDAIKGVPLYAMVHSGDRETLKAAQATLTIDNSTLKVMYRCIRPDGAEVWLERYGRGYFDENGRLKREVGMIVDVTERRRAEEALADTTLKLIKAQEQERARIARELHDDINQRLALLAAELEQLQDDPADIQRRMPTLLEETIEISSDVQAIAHELHSSKLEHLGAVAAMRSWCNEIAESQRLEIDFKSDVFDLLPSEVGLCLFRVLQEALHNAVKHSGTKRISVQMAKEREEVHLTISDSGKGFEINDARQGTGLGLTSMQERVRMVNGTIAIKSKPMGGTSIQVRVPLHSESIKARTVGHV